MKRTGIYIWERSTFHTKHWTFLISCLTTTMMESFVCFFNRSHHQKCDKKSDRSCLTTTVMGSWTWGKLRSCWDVSDCGQMKSRCNWSSFHIYIKTFKNVSKKTHGGKWTINILRSKHQVNVIHYILKYFQKDSGHGGSCELWHYGLLNIILRISQVKKEECLR